VHLDESLVAESMAVRQSLQHSKRVDPLPVKESSVAAAQPLLDSGGGQLP